MKLGIDLHITGSVTILDSKPPAPENLAVVIAGDGGTFSWDAVDGVNGYNLYSDIDGKLNGSLIVGTSLLYDDLSLAEHSITVVSVKGGTESDPSTAIDVDTTVARFTYDVQALDTVELPLISSGTYNFVVEWGDGSQDTITAYDQAERAHEYAEAGEHQVSIKGTCTAFNHFTVQTSRDLIKSVDTWGNVGWDALLNAFHTCENLQSVNGGKGTSNVQSWAQAFISCISLNGGTINKLDVSGANNISAMFYGATSFNQPISSWDISNVTNMSYFLHGATSFNQPIAHLDTSSVTNMLEMLRNCVAFDQPLGTLDISNVTIMSSFLNGGGLSTENYDELLIGWESQAVQNNVSFHAGSSQYTSGGAAEAARTALINDHTWSITDGGAA